MPADAPSLSVRRRIISFWTTIAAASIRGMNSPPRIDAIAF
jgi:hypothetical protein